MTSLLLRKCLVQSAYAPSWLTKHYVRAMASPGGKSARIAVAQMRSTNDKQHNLAQVQQITERAKAHDVQFIFFPECCDYVGTHREETLKLSEPLTGPTVEEYKKLARDNDVWMSFGGVHESIIEESNESCGQTVKNIYNTHLLINNAGELVASYRKLHMFNVVTPEFKFRESETVRSGPALIPPVASPIGRIGLQICYDMRFAEASIILRKQGADILQPSAFAVSTGRAHWEVLLRARAIENQCFVVAAAQIGFHNKKRESYGHAMVVNPWGEILGEAGQQDLDVVVVELNYAKLESVRNNMPCFEHRRDDVYSLSARDDLPYVSGASSGTENYSFGGKNIHPDIVFYVSEHCFAFTNIRCVVPGHVLVSTKRAAHRLPDLTPAERNDFFQTICKVEKVAERLYSASSTTVTVQDGPEAGQTVRHVHCHIMPRHAGDFPENDQIYTELNQHDKEPERPRRSDAEMADEAKRFRDEFSRHTINVAEL